MTELDTEGPATRGRASIRVEASPDAVYAHLTDLTRLPLLSPENVRCEFLDGHESIAVGARFRGHNKSGDYEWHADCEVTVADPGRAFAFEVPPGYEHATTWRYEIEPEGDASIVTESFHAPLLALPDVYPGRIEGRRDNLEKACRVTLDNLRAAFEQN
jgi:hypothetical protein